MTWIARVASGWTAIVCGLVAATYLGPRRAGFEELGGIGWSEWILGGLSVLASLGFLTVLLLAPRITSGQHPRRAFWLLAVFAWVAGFLGALTGFVVQIPAIILFVAAATSPTGPPDSRRDAAYWLRWSAAFVIGLVALYGVPSLVGLVVGGVVGSMARP